MKATEKIIIFTAVLTLAIVLVFSTTYAYFSYSSTQNDSDSYKTACYNVSFSEGANTSITIDKGYPITDTEGWKQKHYTMTLTNNCPSTITYNVLLSTTNDSTTTDSLIKIGYTKGADSTTGSPTTSLVSSLGSHSTLDSMKKTYAILSNQSLAPNTSVSYNVTAWMNSTSTSGQNTKFVYKLGMEVV